MELQIQDLVSSIKKDGIDSANQQAAAILADARKQADAIVAEAKSQADKLRDDAKTEIDVFKTSAQLSAQQAKRDAVLAFRQEIQKEFEKILAADVGKALDQQTRQTVVSAFRGTIYDRNGSQLAVSVSTEDVVMSPYHMKKQLDDEAERLEKIRLENAQLKKGETPQSEDTTVLWDYDSLAASLADILGISQDDVRDRMNNTDSQYELLAKKVDEDTANQIRQLINDLNVEGLDLTATSKRVYPYGSLASHVLGFVGTDNTGLYGLESRYDKYLQGQTGLVVTAKDERGNPLYSARI